MGRLRRLESLKGDAVVFGSNDYLGLARDPEVVAALCEGASRYGAGAAASPLAGGYGWAHQEFEEALAEFLNRERVLLFASGMAANLGALSALLDRHAAAFADKRNHASLIDGVRLSSARSRRYPHGDYARLRALLAREKGEGSRLLVSDGVFSMDGDCVDVAALVTVAQEHGAGLYLDDAHGIGVLGEGGRGLVAAAYGQEQVPVLVGTLGKAFGLAGAFVAGSRALIEYLVNHARTLIYSTALPPALAWAGLTALRKVAEEEWRRKRLHRHVAALQEAAVRWPWPLLPSSTPIQALVLGENDAAVDLSRWLLAQGLAVPAIRPPTVPPGTARLRISLSAAHSDGDVQRLIAALDGYVEKSGGNA